MSGGDEAVQICSEVKTSDKEDQERIASQLQTSTPVALSVQQSLALKAELQIPWNKLRLMKM